MAYSGTFSIEVTGDPRTGSSIVTFEARIHGRALMIDENVKMEERNFQRITYTIIWSGIPKNMVALTKTWDTLISIIDVNLTRWSFVVKVDLIEKEGE